NIVNNKIDYYQCEEVTWIVDQSYYEYYDSVGGCGKDGYTVIPITFSTTNRFLVVLSCATTGGYWYTAESSPTNQATAATKATCKGTMKTDYSLEIYSAVCPVGYTGTAPNCVDVNECSTNNGGCAQTCTNTPGSFACSCAAGYTLNPDGKGCTDINECATSNGGCAQTCTNSPGSFACSCDSGYTLNADKKGCTGYLKLNIHFFFIIKTKIDINECATSNGGCAHTCTNSIGSFVCSCDAGYTLNSDKKGCTDINECSTNNGGCAQTCTNSPGSFACSCGSGYTLNTDKKGCTDIDECKLNTAGCSDMCTNTIGSFVCSCPSGYYLAADKKTCLDINECLTTPTICGSAICNNQIGSYNCSCENGYELTPNNQIAFTCEDIDECDRGISGCSQLCENTIGSFLCSCESGYTLNADKKGCTDINECITTPTICGSAICNNQIGSYNCSCENGYELTPNNENSYTCEDIDECDRGISGCSQLCENNIGSFSCSCESGYTLDADKKGCTDIDECIDGGGCEQICNNLMGSFECLCDPGYSLDDDKKGCTDIDECVVGSSGCAQNCKNLIGSFECSCDSGFTLNDDKKGCTDIDECIDGGGCSQYCHNSPGSYSCSCDSGYVLDSNNKICLDINECLDGSNKCIGVSVCKNTIGSYDCQCPNGFVSTSDKLGCEDIDECSSIELNKCANNTNCLNTFGDYNCPCIPYFSRFDKYNCVPKPIISNFYQKPTKVNIFQVEGYNFIASHETKTLINSQLECTYLSGNENSFECFTSENTEVRGNVTVECNQLVSDSFNYIGAPFLTQYVGTPSTMGGDIITLFGRNLPTGNIQLLVNSNPQNITIVDEDYIEFQSSQGSGKNNLIRLSNETATNTDMMFIEFAHPTINNASEVSGETGGVLTIQGDNFGTNPSLIRVDIGKFNCFDIKVTVPHKELTCLLKPQTTYFYTQLIDLEVDSLPVDNDYYFTFSFLKETLCPSECSGNGYCSDFGCVCNKNFTGISCNETVVEINPHPPIIDIPSIEIDNDDNKAFGYNVSIIRIEELNIEDVVITSYSLLEEKWSFKNNSELNNQWIFNITLNNKCYLEATFEYFKLSREITFAANTFVVPAESLKLTFITKDWPFKSKLNSLRIVVSTQTINLGGSSCSIDKPVTSTFNQHLWTTTKNEESGMTARFISAAEIDERPITPKIESLESSRTTSIVGISVPYFRNKSVIDPDFSMLLNVNKQKTGNCQKENKVDWKIATGTAIGASAAVCLIAAAGYVINRKKKEKELSEIMNKRQRS
ncbi:hypothetical protein DICPUDRAFT_34701, partial [Dictyostelium purpureum]